MKTLDQTYEPVVIDDGDDIGSNLSTNRPLLEICHARLSRRSILKGFVTTAAIGAFGTGTLTSRIALAAGGDPSTLTFTPLEQVITENHAVAPGYSANVLIRWGDAVLAGAPEFDPPTRARTRRPGSSATTATTWRTSRCRGALTAPSTGCCTSITNTPRPS